MFWRRTKRAVKLRVGACSDVGRIRSENQDTFGHFSRNGTAPPEYLFIVADGMGGHVRGQEASRTAVDIVRDTYFARTGDAVEERLADAFQAANAEIYRRARSGTQVETMGTTCTTLAIVGDQVYVAHVGDSRAYRISDAGIEQLTEDHTLVEGLRREGVLTAEEAARHPRRNALTRAMGIDSTIQLDVLSPVPATAGDRYVLCSDGLDEVSPEEIRDVVLANEPQQACERLVQMANERGGRDNVTVMLISIE